MASSGIQPANTSASPAPSPVEILGVDALVKAIKGEKVESLIASGAALVTKEIMAVFN